MAVNNFLPFGTAGGAAVLDQASYAALTPANGWGAGILSKEKYNKAARQSSVMAAMIGNFILGQGFNALDDGNLTTLLANYISALDSKYSVVLSASGVPYGIKVGLVLVQFGAYTSDVTPEGDGPTITFATSFATACLAVMITGRNPTGDGVADSWMEYKAKSTTQFTTFNQWTGSAGGSKTVHGFDWIAIGY